MWLKSGLVAVVGISLAQGALQAGQRPISDFISRQGTFCIDDGMGGCFLFVPPTPNYLGWTDTKAHTGVSMDYAGLADAFLGGALGTTVDGSINERVLDDGTAEVSVVLRTKNALTYALQGSEDNVFDFATDPLLFGVRATDALAGATPSLGECTLHVIFVNPAPGAPLPDLIELAFVRTLDIKLIAFTGRAEGALPDGTPAHLEVVQQGLIGAGLHNGFQGALADAFPAEQIIIRATGK